MGRTRIVLTGLGPKLAGLTWETERLLRLGRQNNVEVVLRDFSVDRLHAEVKFSGGRWVLRDLAKNPLYPTVLNREPLQGAERALALQDVIQLGKLMLRVSELETGASNGFPPTAPSASPPTDLQI